MRNLREKIMAASNHARHSWLTTHLGKGQDILDQAIADAILAIPEIAEALALREKEHKWDHLQAMVDAIRNYHEPEPQPTQSTR